MKKVIYIVKSELNFYPPCVTQIRLLKELGVNIEVIFGSCTENVIQILQNEGIPYVELCDVRNKFKGSLDKLNNWYQFRKSLQKELKRRDLNDTVLWFGNAETLLSMKGALSKYTYAITFLELLDDQPFRMKLLKSLAQNALFNVSCEETRAYIMRAWWSLKELPFVMPNKPYDDPSSLNKLSSSEAKIIIEKIGNKKIILYQGIIKVYELLKTIAEAVNKLDDNYVLLLMGPDPTNLIPRIETITTKLIYSPYIPAPNHLQITSRAYIGIVYYDGNSTLNRVYCAPNKIYEYSAFGKPMLANNIPGLKNTVGICGAAVCKNFTVDEIIDGVKQIESNYSKMKESSYKFFESTDLRAIMSSIIQTKLM